MKKIIRTSLSLFILLVLSACNLFATGNNPVAGTTPVLRLTVQRHDRLTTFSGVGEAITYDYTITNTGSDRLAGPAIVTDEGRQVSCPDVATVGNLDIYLDLNETLTCTSTYTVTQSDVNTGSVTDLATANVGGINSNQSGVTLTLGAPPAAQIFSGTLALTKTASSQTYGQVGEVITYKFSITNTAANPLGPTQFVINDSKLGPAIPCGPAQTTLAPSQSVNCDVPYTITQADMAVPNLSNTATASGGGQNSAQATLTIANLTVVATQTAGIQTATLSPASNLTPGITIQHQVAVGEWLIQIGRCYGANFTELRNANPQIADPNFILPAMMVTVPRIGSVGRIWGPPCVTFYTVQSGDTWETIAARYDADLVVLHKVNPVTLAPGIQIKIPVHSAGTGGITPAPSTATFTATATATPTPTGTTVPAAQRITFPAGQTTVSIAGAVNAGQTVQYIVNAAMGQVLNVSLTGPTGTEVTLGVKDPTGLVLKQPDGTFTWNTTIAATGDHLISVTGLPGIQPKTYALTVSLTTPAAATATFTATSTVTSTPPTPGSP